MSSVASDEDFACIPGLGENKQKPRVLGSFFDVVDDAFSGRSPSLPSETDSVLDSRSVSVIEESSSASNLSEFESRSNSAASNTASETDVLANEEGNSQEVYDAKPEKIDNGYVERDENIFSASCLLLKNVTIAQADGGAVPADVLVHDGKIIKIDSCIEDVSDDVIKITSARGLWLTPGSVKLLKLRGDEEENNNLSGGSTVMLHPLSAARPGNFLEALSQKMSALTGLSPANFGFGYHLENINELSRNDVEEVLATDKGVNMITFNLSKLSNVELIQTFRRIEHLGCIARVQVDASCMVSHFSRLGVSSDSEELEEAQARRVSTLAKQTGLTICLSGLTHQPALKVVKEFRRRGADIWAELSDKVAHTTVKWVLDDNTLRDIVITAPAAEVTDLTAHVQLSCVNPLKMLRSSRGGVVTGGDADLVLWTKNDDTLENNEEDNLTKYSVKYVLVNGSVALVAGEGVNPTRAGQFVELTRVNSDEGRSRDHGQPTRVERERSEDPSERVKTAGISLDPAGVTSLDQVPRMFQRRVSAFGVRNQQDSTFSLASENLEQFEDPETRHTSLTGSRRASVHQSSDQSEASVRAMDQSEVRYQSLTGSRRASVRVRAPPGGLSSGFW